MTKMITASRWMDKPEGVWLKDKGWKITPASAAGITPKGTACTKGQAKLIIFKDAPYHDSSLRDREYVLLHEMAHAIHYEVLHYVSRPLVTGRGLDFDDALECVADAYCYRRNFSPSMKYWVTRSVRWHKLSTTAQYTMPDVLSSEAKQIVNELKAAVGV